MQNKTQNNPKQPNGIFWVCFSQFCNFLTQWDMKNAKMRKYASERQENRKNEKNGNPLGSNGLQI